MITLVFIKRARQILVLLKSPLKWLFLFLGGWFLFVVIISFTTLPFWMYYNLSYTEDKIDQNPDYIVVMSGGGIPSESGLMRTYKTAEVALEFPSANIVITMPGDTLDENSANSLMKKELVLRGVNASRIRFENVGTNTRSQAVEVAKLVNPSKNVLVVTSPEHICRTILSFKKVGFINVAGDAAYSQPVEAPFEFDDKELGGNTLVPEIGDNKQLRYQFWGHLKLQVVVYREYCALGYYWLKDWI